MSLFRSLAPVLFLSCLLAPSAQAKSPTKPCASAVSNEQLPGFDNRAFKKHESQRYQWDKTGYLKREVSRSKNDNPKYGDTESVTTYEHDKDGRPRKLQDEGKVMSPDGKKIIHRQSTTRLWNWKQGRLESMEWTEASASSTIRMRLRFAWSTEASTMAPQLSHIDAMTWLDAHHRDRQHLYALLFAGGSGEVEVTTERCDQHSYGKETCKAADSATLRYDDKGRLLQISGNADIRIEHGEHGPSKAVDYDKKYKETTTQTWSYDKEGRLVEASQEVVNGDTTTTTAHKTSWLSGAPVSQARHYASVRGKDQPYTQEEKRFAWRMPPCK